MFEYIIHFYFFDNTKKTIFNRVSHKRLDGVQQLYYYSVFIRNGFNINTLRVISYALFVYIDI